MTDRFLLLVLAVSATTAAGCNVADRRGSETTCWVHGSPLEDDTVPIYYGTMLFDEQAIYAEMYTFPNSMTHGTGGCMVADWMPRHQMIRYCARCRDAEAKFREEKRSNAGDKYVERYRDPITGEELVYRGSAAPPSTSIAEPAARLNPGLPQRCVGPYWPFYAFALDYNEPVYRFADGLMVVHMGCAEEPGPRVHPEIPNYTLLIDHLQFFELVSSRSQGD